MDSFFITHYSKDDLNKVSRIVQECESFVVLIDGPIYDIHQYLTPSEFSNFTAILDRNVYTRICALIRGQVVSPLAHKDHQWAAAIMAFCQIAEISFQYGSSLQEYASVKGGLAAVSDYEWFCKADSCDPQAWIDFAVGRSSTLDLRSITNLASPVKVPTASRFEDPIYEFRLNYILILKLFIINQETTAPERQMLNFMDWMKNEFFIGAGALLFANILFSPSRHKKMLKKQTLQDAKNIAWDLALLQHWKKCALAGIQTAEPVILVTKDRLVKKIASSLTGADEEEIRSLVAGPWGTQTSKGEMIFHKYLELNESVQQCNKTKPLATDQELDALTFGLEQELARLEKFKGE